MEQFQTRDDEILEDAVKNIFDISAGSKPSSHTPSVVLNRCSLLSCGNQEDKIASELLSTSLEIGKFGTKLFYKSPRTIQSNAADIVRQMLIEQLNLPRLEYKIVEAQFKHDGILFEMKEAKDVVQILTQAKLKDLSYAIEATDRDFFEVAIGQRINN